MDVRDPTAASAREPVVSLRELFDAHAAYVWNTFRHLGVPNADLEDLTHDLFIEVRRHLDDYDPQRPMRPWLFGFAFRIAAMRRRRVVRRREAPAVHLEELADATLPQDEMLSRAEDRRLVREALALVDLDRRAVFILYEIDGESMSDIATALGIPVNTAYSRLRLARGDFAAAVKRINLKGARR